MVSELLKLIDTNLFNKTKRIYTSVCNRHLKWFERLLFNHFEVIIAHASIWISSGKIEGINQKIKTLRWHGYVYPYDEYFFLKLFDMSRQR